MTQPKKRTDEKKSSILPVGCQGCKTQANDVQKFHSVLNMVQGDWKEHVGKITKTIPIQTEYLQLFWKLLEGAVQRNKKRHTEKLKRHTQRWKAPIWCGVLVLCSLPSVPNPASEGLSIGLHRAVNWERIADERMSKKEWCYDHFHTAQIQFYLVLLVITENSTYAHFFLLLTLTLKSHWMKSEFDH